MEIKYHDTQKINQLINKHIALSDCKIGNVMVKDCNNPPGIIGIVVCQECNKEIGEVILGKDY